MALARALTALVIASLIASVPGMADAAPRKPKIRSKAMVVIDAGTGALVFGKDADDIRPIASMTKIFVAMAVRRKGLVLKDWSEITADDVEAAKGGARTRLPEGEQFKNVDLLRAMLMVSDNRAPTALGRSVGLDTEQLIDEMNAVAQDLGLEHTHFIDTTGIGGNISTARELAMAMKATLEDPVLAKILSTHKVRITSKSRKAKVDYRTTLSPLHEKKYEINGGKSGHTETAGYCMIVGATLAGKDYILAFLGGATRKVRFFDFDRVAKWLERTAKLATK